jgi:hypothetical protein
MTELESQLGFNRVITIGDEIWASHGEAGVVSWKVDQSMVVHRAHPERAVAIEGRGAAASVVVSGSGSQLAAPAAGRAAGPRNLLALDESRLIYSVGGELVVRLGDSRNVIHAGRSEIIAIVRSPQAAVAVHEDGSLVLVDAISTAVIDTRGRGTQLSAAGAMPWLGDVRLLLAEDHGPITCIGLDDPLVSEYLSPYRGLKVVTATDDLIAAVSPDRQRIILWHVWDGQRPVGEVHVTSRTRHRIADVEFIA